MNQSYTEQEKNGLNHHRSSYRLPFAAMAMLLSSISPVFAAHHIVTDASVQNADGSNQLAQQESQVSGENEDREDAVSVNNNTYETLISNQNQFGVITIESRNAPLGKNPNYIIDASGNNVNDSVDSKGITPFTIHYTQRDHTVGVHIRSVSGDYSLGAVSYVYNATFLGLRLYSSVPGPMVEKNNNVLIGNVIPNTGYGTVAIGMAAQARNDRTVAIGHKIVVEGNQTVAIGDKVSAKADNAVIIGEHAKVEGANSVTIGYRQNGADQSIIIGEKVKVHDRHTEIIAIGHNVDATRLSIQIGSDIDHRASDALLIGHNIQSSWRGEILIGSEYSSTGQISDPNGRLSYVSIGKGSRAHGHAGAIAIGTDAATNYGIGYNSDDLPYQPFADVFQEVLSLPHLSAISFGQDLIYTRQITGVAAGTEDNDAVNVAQLKAVEKYFTDNISQYKETMEEINSELDTLGDKVNKVHDEAQKNRENVESLETSFTALNKNISDSRAQINTNTKTIDEIAYQNYAPEIANVRNGIQKAETDVNQINTQANQIKEDVDFIQDAIDNLDSKIETGIQSGGVMYEKDRDGKKTNRIRLWVGTLVDVPSQHVTVKNLADGKVELGSKEAVNTGQLYDGLQNLIKDTNAYTDEKIDENLGELVLTADENLIKDTVNEVIQSSLENIMQELENNFEKVNEKFLAFDQDILKVEQDLLEFEKKVEITNKEAKQAAAISLAVASLRYNEEASKLSVSLGVGMWEKQTAFAVGAGLSSDLVKISLSAATSGGHWGIGAGFNLALN